MIKIPYDTGFIEVGIKEGPGIRVLRSGAEGFKRDEDETGIVQAALENPDQSPRLRDLGRGKKNIVIIASDHTRPVPSRVTMPLLLDEIRLGNRDASLTLLISTGLHRPSTEEEMNEKFGRALLERFNDVVNHRAEVDEDMVFMGKLPSGGDLYLNRVALEADLLVAEGFIEPHFFAGFSGGRKSILPGIASRRTVLFNHNADFIDSRFARTGILENNPIHRDMAWAAEKAGLAFILNVVINSSKEVIYAVAGHPIKAHEKGCSLVKQLASVQAAPADIIISSNGGYPMDQNVYQSVKGMTAAEATAKEGAVIIMVAGCRDGVGGDHFYRMIADSGRPEYCMSKILATPNTDTCLDQWESQILARVLIRHRVIMVTDKRLKETLEKMHIEFAATVDEALDMARVYKGEDASITVIPDGVGIIVGN